MAEPLLSSTKSLVVALPEVRVPMTVARPASSSAAAAASATPAVPSLVSTAIRTSCKPSPPSGVTQSVRLTSRLTSYVTRSPRCKNWLATSRAASGEPPGLERKSRIRASILNLLKVSRASATWSPVFSRNCRTPIYQMPAGYAWDAMEGRSTPGCMAQLENRDSHNGGSPAGLPRGVHPERALSG